MIPSAFDACACAVVRVPMHSFMHLLIGLLCGSLEFHFSSFTPLVDRVLRSFLYPVPPYPAPPHALPQTGSGSHVCAGAPKSARPTLDPSPTPTRTLLEPPSSLVGALRGLHAGARNRMDTGARCHAQKSLAHSDAPR